ncbi:VRR-NUC domain-containing protein [Cloacibacillus evryensis]|uniref:VRR-NUC domain-containing protein n=1 Tax=Cloacibacillus evryensis TaxID=508460 RepID=UPI00241EAF8F|nr:VRR-NUC domain-containing protein [Cloacibacillus evryensis]
MARAAASPVPKEHEEQKAFMALAECLLPLEFRPLLWATPNAAKRSPKTASIMLAEGLKSGVPDLFLAIPCGGKAGLFIEMKRRRGGTVSAEQKSYMELLRRMGYRAEVCRGCDEALAVFKDYLKIK